MTKIVIATYDHRHGMQLFTFASFDDAERWRQELVLDQWAERIPDDIERPDDPEECADAYFEFMGNQFGSHEWLSVEEVDLPDTTIEAIKAPIIASAKAEIDNLLTQIEQMKGMFSDEDGSIQAAIESAEAWEG